jgi:predicted nucleotidyltransferase
MSKGKGEMNQQILRGLREAKRAFPSASFFVFGSHARGDAHSDSDLDVCAVFPRLTKDPFELAFEVRTEIHKYLDMALDVVISDEGRMATKSQDQWTIEAAIQKEGVPV